MKIVCLLPDSTDASLQVALINLRHLENDLTVLAFERNIYIGHQHLLEFVSLGRIRNKHYIERIGSMIKAIPKVHSKISNAHALFVYRGLDLLVIAWIARLFARRKPKLVYHVADIQSIMMQDGFVSKVFRAIEGFLFRDVDLVVTTSEAYISGYYEGKQKLNNVKYHVIENKVDSKVVPAKIVSVRKNVDKQICIGYFGLLRCAASWQVLQNVVRESGGRIRVYMRGVVQGLDNFNDVVRDNPLIEYGGPFVNPDELASIYNEVDIVWAAIHHAQANILWSRVHRFYQACYFQKPIIAQLGSQDGVFVQKNELGLCVDLSDIKQATRLVLEVNENNLIKWQHCINSLDPNVYTLSNEYTNLISMLETTN